MAWRAADLRDDEWRLALPGPVITELGAVVDKVRGATVPAVALRPEDFLLPATRQFMAKVRSRLREGRGFVVLNGLPVREWAGAGSTLAYWLLSGLVARPVAQKLDGTLVSDVHDTGLQGGRFVFVVKSDGRRSSTGVGVACQAIDFIGFPVDFFDRRLRAQKRARFQPPVPVFGVVCDGRISLA